MDSKERFSDRVGNYVKYRPSYPKEAIEYLFGTVGFSSRSAVADIGAGTGIFTRLLAPRVGAVYAVEPNEPMRQAALAAQTAFRNIHAVAASAEETTLPDHSVDFITAAQSFHWFDRDRCKAEFRRILKPEGRAVLIWNDELMGDDYGQIQKNYSKDYTALSRKRLTDADYSAFFTGPFTRTYFKNQQQLDHEGFFGRILSSSYSPLEGDSNHEPFMAALQNYFDHHARGGQITIDYRTELIWGGI